MSKFVTGVALVLSAVAVALATWAVRGGPTEVEPLRGVCVDQTSGVDRAYIVNGVVSCLTGQFVPVEPTEYKP